MAEFDTLELLARLPLPSPLVHRLVPPCMDIASRSQAQVEDMFEPRAAARVCSEVETYVRDVINGAPLLTGELDLVPLMEDLHVRQGLCGPVVELHHVLAGLQGLPPADRARFEAVPHVYARVLRTLNPPGTPVVSPELVALAARRERAMAGLPHGWGTSEPPVSATAHRLLLSVGVDARLLPPVKTPPAEIRTPLMMAWSAACARFGWTCIHPDKEIAAERRTVHRTVQPELAASCAPPRQAETEPEEEEGPEEDLDELSL